MDNSFFEILVAIYLIFTFVAGILKKKKRNEARNSTENVTEISVDNPETSKPQNDATRDIINQLLGFGTNRQQEEYPNYDEHSEDDDFILRQNNEETPTWNPESEFNDTEFEQDSMSPVDNLASEYIPEDKKSEFQTPENNDYHLSENESNYFIPVISTSTLIKKLKNRASLKEAILLSEIIGKPKALRKNG